MAMAPPQAAGGQQDPEDQNEDQSGLPKDPQQLLQMVGEGLTTIVNGLGQSGAPKNIIAPFQASLDAYTAGFKALQSGGQGQQQQPGVGPPEAGRGGAMPAGSNQMRG